MKIMFKTIFTSKSVGKFSKLFFIHWKKKRASLGGHAVFSSDPSIPVGDHQIQV